MTPSHVRECLASLRDELYELALDLVRTPSVTGDEDAAQETLAARFRDWGLDVDLWTVEASLTAHRAYCDEQAGDRDDWLKENPVRVEWFEGQFEPGETDAKAPVLEDLSACHQEVLGEAPVSHGVSYGSDLRLFTRYAEMPAVLYGPGDVALAHAANEWLPLDELVQAAEVLTLLIARKLDA